MGVERTVTNLFHPNLTIFDENSILGCILADAEKLFLNVYVFVPIFSLELGFGPISNKSSQVARRGAVGILADCIPLSYSQGAPAVIRIIVIVYRVECTCFRLQIFATA